MTKILRPAFAGKRPYFDISRAERAIRASFTRQTLYIALELAWLTPPTGEADVLAEELQSRSGFGRRVMLASLQELVASGLVTRVHPKGSVLLWRKDEIERLAAQYRPPGKKKKQDTISHYLQGTWLDSLARTCPVAGIPVRPPHENQWEAIEIFGAEQTTLHGVTLERIADISCEAFYRRSERTARTDGQRARWKRLEEIGKYAGPWLASELDADMAATIARRLKTQTATQSTPPPAQSGVGFAGAKEAAQVCARAS